MLAPINSAWESTSRDFQDTEAQNLMPRSAQYHLVHGLTS